MSDLHNALVKLARDVPELRKHLVPILRKESRMLLAEPNYRDYLERKRREGKRPLSQEEWEARVYSEEGDAHPERADEDAGDLKKQAPHSERLEKAKADLKKANEEYEDRKDEFADAGSKRSKVHDKVISHLKKEVPAQYRDKALKIQVDEDTIVVRAHVGYDHDMEILKIGISKLPDDLADDLEEAEEDYDDAEEGFAGAKEAYNRARSFHDKAEGRDTKRKNRQERKDKGRTRSEHGRIKRILKNIGSENGESSIQTALWSTDKADPKSYRAIRDWARDNSSKKTIPTDVLEHILEHRKAPSKD